MNQSSPLVSIIVPNYNHERYLVQRLESIFNQTFQDFEVILLDDCSTDDSVIMLQRYATHPKVTHFVVNEQNTGSPFKQWKKGIDLARGKYIWIAESDDWAESTFLEILLPLINQEDVGIAFCNSNWVDEKGAIGKSLSLYQADFQRTGLEEIKAGMLKRCSVQNVSAVLMRKSVLDNTSDQFTNFKACGDWILYTEMLLQSSIAYCALPLNNFRWYHNNISNTAFSKGIWMTEGVKVLQVVKKRLRLPIDLLINITGAWLRKSWIYLVNVRHASAGPALVASIANFFIYQLWWHSQITENNQLLS